MTEEKQDLYARVTQRIIADLEEEVKPWQQIWINCKGSVLLPVRTNGVRYRGINVVLLWAETAARGYASPIWITYDQAKSQDGQVRRGERGTMLVFANGDISETNGAAEQPILKNFTVFNAQQINGLPSDCYPQPSAPDCQPERIEGADAFIRATGAVLRHGGDEAFYEDSSDVIQLPVIESFPDPKAYYAVALRALVHWTKHKTRLDRNFGGQQFGDEGQARGVLVAELGSAFLCAELGITPLVSEQHATPIEKWLEFLDQDDRAIFQVAAEAQRAADYLTKLQPKSPEPNAQNASNESAAAETTAAPAQPQEPVKKDRRRHRKQEAAAPQ